MTGGKGPRARGDRFERAVIARLRALDYYVVRSAGSFGVADIVALRADRPPLLISCKVTDRTTKRERVELAAAAIDAGATPVIAYKTGRGVTRWVRVHGPEGARAYYDVGGPTWPTTNT